MQCFFGRNGHPVLYDCCRVSRVHVSCISLQNLYGSDIRVCVGRVCGVQPKNAPSFYYAHRHFTRFGINNRLRKYDVPGLCHTEGLRGLTLIQAPSPRSSLIAQLGRMVVEATAQEERDRAICLCSWTPVAITSVIRIQNGGRYLTEERPLRHRCPRAWDMDERPFCRRRSRNFPSPDWWSQGRSQHHERLRLHPCRGPAVLVSTTSPDSHSHALDTSCWSND